MRGVAQELIALFAGSGECFSRSGVLSIHWLSNNPLKAVQGGGE